MFYQIETSEIEIIHSILGLPKLTFISTSFPSKSLSFLVSDTYSTITFLMEKLDNHRCATYNNIKCPDTVDFRLPFLCSLSSPGHFVNIGLDMLLVVLLPKGSACNMASAVALDLSINCSFFGLTKNI